MKKIALVFLFIVGISISYACSIDDDQVHTFFVGQQRYEVVKSEKTWSDAAACAVLRGGYLAEIQNQNEQDSVLAGIQAADIPNNYVQVSDGGGVAYVWIGATDRAGEGQWLWNGTNENDKGTLFWNNGSSVSGAFANWGSSNFGQEPDNYLGNQNAGAIALADWPVGTAGQWNDINEANQLYFVSEYPESVEEQADLNLNQETSLGDRVIVGPSLKSLWIRYQKKLGPLFKAKVYNAKGSLALEASTYQHFQSYSFSTGKYFVQFIGVSEVFAVWVP
jgi:hypothetical protein